MNRRGAVLALASMGGAAFAGLARARAATGLRVIAWLSPVALEAERPGYDAFVSRLKALGHAEGREIAIVGRWAEGRLEALPALAAELVALGC